MHPPLEPRLLAIATEARARGWNVTTADTPHRTELLVTPSIPGEQCGALGLGFGITLGASTVSCWVWEAWAGTLLLPWHSPTTAISPDQEPHLCPQVHSLADALPLFDAAADQYLASMRELDPDGATTTWAPIPPLAA